MARLIDPPSTFASLEEWREFEHDMQRALDANPEDAQLHRALADAERHIRALERVPAEV